MTTLPEAVQLLNTARQCVQRKEPAVYVSVVSTRGSAPRQTGAAMIVCQGSTAGKTGKTGKTGTTQTTGTLGTTGTISTIGTIGGGRLEHIAIKAARAQLAEIAKGSSKQETTNQAPINLALDRQNVSVSAANWSITQEYPLGAALGQCCGGAMTLHYSMVSESHLHTLASEIANYKTLFLFGAGHVAQALVPVLCPLPLNIVWIETRDQINALATPFPTELPPHIQTIITDSPEAELRQCKGGDLALIMTHSHALDETLVRAALQRQVLAYIGLIGSATKRRLFEQRLAQRGLAAADFERLSCPIGVKAFRGIEGVAGVAGVEGLESSHRKLPAVIALQVAAELATYL